MRTETEMTRQKIIRLLSQTDFDEQQSLFKRAYALKVDQLGKNVNLRGLIEFSNQCGKNCLYCGIRSGNSKVVRYSMTDDEVIQVVVFAKSKGLTGVVLQSGERNDTEFIDRITSLIQKIKQVTEETFRITLSVGEQTAETYKRWFDAGAQRYLLRIETSDETLYGKIHPNDGFHSYETRLRCLEHIRQAGFQTGTGVMIGLPGQTFEDLADDLLFIQQKGIDMVGMGPFLEHAQTPMFEFKEERLPLLERFELSLRMIAVLRLLMPTINIASTTALQSVIPTGREFGLKAGANVIMPNMTPAKYRKNYLLYENKPGLDKEADETLENLLLRIQKIGEQVVYHDYGDSKHYINRQPTANTL
jgi:biotin synthase